MIKQFINLSGGVEWMPHVHVDGYVRIQSTWLEQKRWWPVMADLDYGFLLAITMGHDVVVYDTSSHKEQSRAIYQGIPWITYVLHATWLGREYIPFVKSHNVHGYFAECLEADDPMKSYATKRLAYIARLTNPFRVSLKGECMPAMHDGDYDWLGLHLIDHYA